MRSSLRRYTVLTVLLVSLAFVLWGCGGGGGGSSQATATKSVSGFVSDPATGLPVSDASVTAYAIGADGVPASTPLSEQVASGDDGSYELDIPASYEGSVLVEAELPTLSKIPDNTMKQVSLAGPVTRIRSILPSVSQSQTVMVSLATEMMVEYVGQNLNNTFSVGNIQTATVVLERFFGQNFTQFPPPADISSGTTAQLDLLVMTRAFNNVLGSVPSIADLVTVSGGSLTNMAAVADELDDASVEGHDLDGAISGYINAGTFSVDDTTAPSKPAGLAFSASSATSVTLSWTPATDNVGVTAYYVYRNGLFVDIVPVDNDESPSYLDNEVTGNTTYRYSVKACDAAGNISESTAITVATTHAISGRVTYNGAGLAGVTIDITGAGAGSTVTDSSGNYSFAGLVNGTYTIIPSRAGYAFTPSSKDCIVTNADATGQNFTATQSNGGSIVIQF